MRLDLSEDQTLLHETTVRFIEAELPLAQTRTLHDNQKGFDKGWLQKAAALGWFAMLVPEADGGGSVSGDGIADAAIIAEEVGRHVQPGPFVPMNVVAATLAAHGTPAQRARWLGEIVTAEAVATCAFANELGGLDGGVGVSLDGGALRGARGFVQDALGADLLLVSAIRDGLPVQVLVPTDAQGVQIEPLDSLDLSRRFAHVRFDEVNVDDDAVIDGVDVDAQLHTAVALNVADTIGAADRLKEMTVAYAKDRIAFGRPIGSFQALKHLLADQAVHLETCKAGLDAALRSLGGDATAAAEVISVVAAYVGDTTNDLAQECLQIHGGIGFTWEHDLHLLLRRVRSNVALFGEPTWHRERVCAVLGLDMEVGA